jgi:hypothetical protein
MWFWYHKPDEPEIRSTKQIQILEIQMIKTISESPNGCEKNFLPQKLQISNGGFSICTAVCGSGISLR